jgi:hypothetical protein
MDINENSTVLEQAMPVQVTEAEAEQQQGFNVSFPEWLKAKTGSGSIEEYMEHPMNFTHNKAMARIIRGATGLFGALDLAIIDIGVGALELFRGEK